MHPGHVGLVHHHPGPGCGLYSVIPRAGGNDILCYKVDLGDDGTDGGCHLFLALLVMVGPDGAQRVTEHHLLK